MLVHGRTVMDVLGRKRAAVEFLHLVAAGRIDEAFDRFLHPRARHHDMHSKAGVAGLRAAMLESHRAAPAKQLQVLHVLGEDDLVAVHSRITLAPAEAPVAAVHLFRFEGDKVVEMWDLAQPVQDTPNTDGAF